MFCFWRFIYGAWLTMLDAAPAARWEASWQGFLVGARRVRVRGIGRWGVADVPQLHKRRAGCLGGLTNLGCRGRCDCLVHCLWPCVQFAGRVTCCERQISYFCQIRECLQGSRLFFPCCQGVVLPMHL